MAGEDCHTWGCYTYRPFCNLLSGALALPAGDRCAGEFLIFDTKDKVPYLCRYVDAGRTICKTSRLQLQPTLSNPRQLLLSGRLRIFASLEIISGVASVALWQLPAEVNDVADCQLVDALPRDDAKTAKAICLSGRTLPPCIQQSNESELLSVLLSDRVLLIQILPPDGTGTMTLRQLSTLQLSFPCRCLSWSNDASQLLVGGKGQLMCFAWTEKQAELAEPSVRHLLASGECVEIQALFSNTFLCRIDQVSQPSEPELILPGSRESPVLSRPLVQVIENPQDDQDGLERPSLSPMPGGVLTNLGSAWQNPVPTELAGVGLQVDRGRAGLRLHCGAEREAGELVAVAEQGGKGVVVHGSFNSSKIFIWRLSPPHHWGRSDWHGPITLNLLPSASLRVSGLSVWPGVQGLELHALLSEAPSAGDFGRPKRELFHRSEALPDPVTGTAGPSCAAEAPRSCAAQEETETGSADRNEALLSIASNVAGMRQEMGTLRETLDGFRQDFSRLVVAIEKLAAKN